MSDTMPHEQGMDHTLTLLREGYLYILNRRKSFSSDIFETRLLGKKAICMGGREAAEVFYDEEKFKREGAAPNRLKQTLFGKNGVQSLDGDHHKQRKAMFMSLMSPDHIKQLTNIFAEELEAAIKKWAEMDKVTFYEEAQVVLCRTACRWSGVPVQESEIEKLTHDLQEMFETPAAVGPEHWKGRHSRNRVEKQISSLVEKVRGGELKPAENTALYQFAWHRDPEEELLDPRTAAVEVINILRPVVAISVYLSFTVLALHHNPEEKEKLKSADETYARMFVQEVRRFYPFFPFAAARVKKHFTWQGYNFEEGTLTLLDLYGTNHDPVIWDNPELFEPGRFKGWEGSPFSFIPQGGGDYHMGHRCAGEWITIEVMKTALDHLINKVAYELPDQDLSYSMVSMPSLPHSRIMMKNVKALFHE